MIFLTILKIIGIVLASIVGLVLLVALLVLFAPIRYKIAGTGKNENVQGVAKASWLFGILSAKAEYFGKNLEYKVSVIGISLLKGGIGDKFPKPEEAELEDSESEVSEAQNVEHADIELTEPTLKKNPEAEDDFNLEIEIINLDKDISKYRPFKRGTEKNIEIESDVDTLFDAIENYVNSLSEKYNRIKRKVTQFKIVLTSNAAKRAFKLVKVNVLNILNHIKPGKISGNLNFGLEDPANTAIIYGTVDIFAEYLSKGRLILIPDFTQKVIDMNVNMYGRIFAGYVILCGLRVFFDQDVKRVVKVLRRII